MQWQNVVRAECLLALGAMLWPHRGLVGPHTGLQMEEALSSPRRVRGRVVGKVGADLRGCLTRLVIGAAAVGWSLGSAGCAASLVTRWWRIW
jgi:hypothetical protein